jgi:hypothetical protein
MHYHQAFKMAKKPRPTQQNPHKMHLFAARILKIQTFFIFFHLFCDIA